MKILSFPLRNHQFKGHTYIFNCTIFLLLPFHNCIYFALVTTITWVRYTQVATQKNSRQVSITHSFIRAEKIHVKLCSELGKSWIHSTVKLLAVPRRDLLDELFNYSFYICTLFTTHLHFCFVMLSCHKHIIHQCTYFFFALYSSSYFLHCIFYTNIFTLSSVIFFLAM